MKTTNRLQISCSYKRLFALAANIQEWPEILPHYRWVHVLDQSAAERRAEMAARHRGIPLWWRTLQRPLETQRRIEFTHIAGITKGMEVQWTFNEVGESCNGPTWLVQIHHQFRPSWGPIAGPWFADRIIGPLFVSEVANKTLRRIKQIAEGTDASKR